MLLPQYLLKSPKKGTYSFRLVVPADLREAVGKREVKKALKTTNARAALVQAQRLYEEAQSHFLSLRKPTESSRKSPLQLHDDAINWLKSEGLDLQHKSEDECDARFSAADNLIAKIEQGKGSDLDGYKVEALQGRLKRPSPTLTDAVNLYLHERNAPGQRTEADRIQFRQNVMRNLDDLLASVGSDRELTAVSRSNARNFRDYLLRKTSGLKDGQTLKPASVNRILQSVTAIFNHAITEWELNVSNPFKSLSVDEGESRRDKRRSFTDAELRAYEEGLSTLNDEARLCAMLMIYTGARTHEITALQAQDVILSAPVPHIFIRPNSLKPKHKTTVSSRMVPLVGRGLETAREALSRRQANASDPVFPRYGKPRGEDNLSAVLMKLIRHRMKVIDPKLVAYSTRHTMKDRLRNGLIAPELQDAILGHSKGQVSEGYGDGYWLPQLEAAITTALLTPSKTLHE